MTRLDGSPAAGARVTIGGSGPPDPDRGPQWRRERGWGASVASGEDGVAVFRDLPAGVVSVGVREPGFLEPPLLKARIESGRVVRVAVREVPGRSIVVRVVDGQGRPVPGAFVRCEKISWPYAPLDGRGLQSLDLVTGAAGLVFLPRVPDGPLAVEVTRGMVSVRAALEGETAEVTLP